MKILYVSTISNTINAFMVPHIKLLVDQGHHVDVACNIHREINPILKKIGCKVFDIKFNRSPLSKDNYVAYKKLNDLIHNEGYDLVHTHTPVASACVRLVCRKFKNVKVFYTAHGFHFFKGAPLKNWLLYYPIEKWLARYTDLLITINAEDYERANKYFKAKNVEYVPGVGLDTKNFTEMVIDKFEKRKELGVPEGAFLILSVGELNKNKNHETIIKSVARLNNSNIYYVICGQGPLEDYLRKLTNDLKVDNQVKLLGFRKDIAEIFKASDVFGFLSLREGLSVALMEAMASGLPVICSNIRGNRDLIEEKEGGYLVDPYDIEGFARSINQIIQSTEYREKMNARNQLKIKQFDSQNVLSRMKELYKYSNEMR